MGGQNFALFHTMLPKAQTRIWEGPGLQKNQREEEDNTKSEISGQGSGVSDGKPFWLKPFLFKPVSVLRDRSCWFWYILSVLRRVHLVRKGWTQVEVPGGWLQLIRGPRPKSEQWPMQSGRSPLAAQVPGKPPVRGRWRSGAVHRRRADVSAAKVLDGHGSSRSRGWRHESRSRSSVE